jgi:hypothetical protein
MKTKCTKPMSQTAINFAHRFFQKTSIPRMSDEKKARIIAEHNMGRKYEPRILVEGDKSCKETT